MRSGTIAFLLGCLALQQLAQLPSPLWCLLVVPVLLLARLRPALRLPAWLVAGFLWSLLRAGLDLSQPFDARLEGADCVVEAYIAGIPEPQGQGIRALFDITQLRDKEGVQAWTGRVRLSWDQSTQDLQVGERWRLRVRLKQAHGLMNPGGFDYEGWLYQQGIKATGSVRRDPGNRRLAAAGWHYALDRLRQHVARQLARAVPESPYLGILTALVIGAQNGISALQWQVFTRTGTSHLVAISGLNITLVAGLVGLLVRRVWAWLPRAALHFAAPKAAVCAALLSAAGYAFLAGFSIPTRRALVMLAIALGARLFDRQLVPSRTLALALLVILLMDPTAPLTAGFWLSYGAVAVLLYGMSGRLATNVWWRQWGRAQWLVALGLLPMTLMLFQRASLIAPLANLVAEPWMSLVVTPLTLLGTVLLPISQWLGTLVMQLASTLLGWLWPLLVVCAKLPGAYGSWALPAAWIAGLAVAGVLLMLAPRGLPARAVGVVLLLPMLLIRPATPAPGAVWFTLLDVGQGLAAVVRTQHHTLVFDTGPRYSDSFDTGAAVVLPYLRNQGVDFLDMLMVSHGDNDHSGGAASILAGMPVAELSSSVPQRFDTLAEHCQAGQRWNWDGVEFRILHPDQVPRWHGNNGCCVLLVQGRGGSVLLPGDIEADAERRLLTTHAGMLHAAILVAPHHGSQTSSTQDFIASVAPRYVLFPVGYRNRYGFPRPEVLARYTELGSRRLDTDVEGAIGFRIDPETGVSDPVGYRRLARRYWNWRPPTDPFGRP
jgi:competence protein ComEC